MDSAHDPNVVSKLMVRQGFDRLFVLKIFLTIVAMRHVQLMW